MAQDFRSWLQSRSAALASRLHPLSMVLVDVKINDKKQLPKQASCPKKSLEKKLTQEAADEKSLDPAAVLRVVDRNIKRFSRG